VAYKSEIIKYHKESITNKVQENLKDFLKIGFMKDNYKLATSWAKVKKDEERLWSYIWEDLDFLRNLLNFALI